MGNPDQPRVPAGGPNGGQWAPSVGDVVSFSDEYDGARMVVKELRGDRVLVTSLGTGMKILPTTVVARADLTVLARSATAEQIAQHDAEAYTAYTAGKTSSPAYSRAVGKALASPPDAGSGSAVAKANPSMSKVSGFRGPDPAAAIDRAQADHFKKTGQALPRGLAAQRVVDQRALSKVVQSTPHYSAVREANIAKSARTEAARTASNKNTAIFGGAVPKMPGGKKK